MYLIAVQQTDYKKIKIMIFSVITFLNLLLNDYFESSANICYFTNRNVIIYVNNLITTTYNLESSPTFILKQRCDGMLINHSTPRLIVEQIETVLRYQNISRFNYSNRKYIVISDKEFDMKYLFNSPTLTFIVDLLNVVVQRNNNYGFAIDGEVTIELYTHRYVGDNYNEPYLLDVWFSRNSSFLYGNSLFPKKLDNQHGRPLRAVTFTYNPYSVPEYGTGSELRLIQEFAMKYNNTLKLVLTDEMWGTTFPNYTGLGLYRHMLDDVTDVGFCECFYLIEYYDYIDFTVQYMVSTVTCLVPLPVLANTLFILFPHFQMSVWLGLIVAGFLVALTLAWSEEFFMTNETLDYSLMKRIIVLFGKKFIDLGKIMLSQSINEGMGYTVKFSLMMVYVLSIILYSLYNSDLSSKLTIPTYDGLINTVEELAQSPFPWGASQREAWLLALESDDTPKFAMLKDKFIELNTNNLKEMDKVGVLLVRLRSGYFSFEEYIPDEILKTKVVMKDNIYFQLTTMLTRKHSVLLPLLNNFINRITASGMNIYWEKQSIQQTNYKQQMMVMQSVPSAEAQASPIAQYKGLYMLWIAGCLLSFICFILEYKHVI